MGATGCTCNALNCEDVKLSANSSCHCHKHEADEALDIEKDPRMTRQKIRLLLCGYIRQNHKPTSIISDIINICTSYCFKTQYYIKCQRDKDIEEQNKYSVKISIYNMESAKYNTYETINRVYTQDKGDIFIDSEDCVINEYGNLLPNPIINKLKDSQQFNGNHRYQIIFNMTGQCIVFKQYQFLGIYSFDINIKTQLMESTRIIHD